MWTNLKIAQIITATMIMITAAATLTPTAIPIVWSCPLADLLFGVGEGDCTCDVVLCTCVVVQVVIIIEDVLEAVAVLEGALEVVDVFEAACVDVNKVLHEVADGS